MQILSLAEASELLDRGFHERRFDNFFQSRPWIEAWAEYLVDARRLDVLVLDSGDGPAALPVAEIRLPVPRGLGKLLPLRVAVPAGSWVGSGDYFGPLGDPDPAAARRLLDAFVRWADRRTLYIPSTLKGAAFDLALEADGRLLRSSAASALDLRGLTSWDAMEKRWSKNTRRRHRKRSRAWDRMGGEFNWIEDPASLAEAFEPLLRLHRERMAALRKRSAFAGTAELEAFHRSLATRDHPRGLGAWAVVSTHEDQPVGVVFGYRAGGRYHVFQTGWCSRFGDVSLGWLQYCAAARLCLEHGGEMFDMLRGGEWYKETLADRPMELDWWLLPAGPAGPALKWLLTR